MSPDDFQHLQTLLATRAGYRLTRDRMHLAEHRLGPVARREGFASVDVMVATLRQQPPAALAWAVIEALLNGETWFRRDRTPFATLAREVLPAIAGVRPGGRVRILSAGCGAGQEAYSLAIAAAEARIAADITAVDLSQRALEKARSGVYTAFEVQRGLSARQMLRWFEQGEDMWRARPELRQAIAFQPMNLLDAPQGRAKSDVIFCRYVLGDMEPQRRARALDVLGAMLADDGCLFLGLGETVEERADAFRPVAGREGLFIKTPQAVRRAA